MGARDSELTCIGNGKEVYSIYSSRQRFYRPPASNSIANPTGQGNNESTKSPNIKGPYYL